MNRREFTELCTVLNLGGTLALYISYCPLLVSITLDLLLYFLIKNSGYSHSICHVFVIYSLLQFLLTAINIFSERLSKEKGHFPFSMDRSVYGRKVSRESEKESNLMHLIVQYSNTSTATPVQQHQYNNTNTATPVQQHQYKHCYYLPRHPWV